jgi:GNAT superfamily N-acetyltransferase
MGTYFLRILKTLVSYEIWRIYSIDTSRCQSPSPSGLDFGLLRDLAQMDAPGVAPEVRRAKCVRDGALVYAAWRDGTLAGVCWLWPGPLLEKRNIGAQPADCAEIIQITVAEAFRGQGIASALIRYASSQVPALGYRRLYAQIWHSNIASVKAFEKCGWDKVASFVELKLRRFDRPLLRYRRLMPGFRGQAGLLENWQARSAQPQNQ